MSTRITRLATALGAALVFTASAGAASAMAQDPEQSPGDPTLEIAVGDDVAGGTTTLTFERYFAGATANGTPVYVYAPEGAVGGDVTGVEGADPQWDPNPDDEFTPCDDETNTAADFQISDAQLAGLGEELVGTAGDPGIVQVDRSTTARSGSPTRPTRTATRSSCSSTTSATRPTTTATRRSTPPATSPRSSSSRTA